MKNNELDFNKSGGLIPVIIQDYKIDKVYMLGYMNNDAIRKTKESGYVHFWSRSRKKIWMKGEESGNKLLVKQIFSDCDLDTLLIKVKLIGKNVCHTGSYSCFFRVVSLANSNIAER